MEFATRYRPLIATIIVVIGCVFLSSYAISSAPVVDVAAADALEQAGIYEPNDTVDQAKKITVCTPQAHAFEERRDEDWLKFRASAGVRYTIETSDLSEINDTKLWLYDVEGVGNDFPILVNDDDPDRPPASRIDWIAPEEGTYYIKVAHPQADGGVGFTYTIHLAAKDPGEDGFEPDNVMEEATEVAVGGDQQEHTLHGTCGGDADWFFFRARSYYAYNIQTSGLGGGNDTMVCVYDEDGTELACNDDDPDHYPASRLHWEPRRSGTYYVKVTHFHPFAGGDALTYDFQVTRASEDPEPPLPPDDPCADSFELEGDNIPGNAQPIEVNGVIQDHTFHEAGDADWVKFWAFAGDTYTIETSELETGNDTYICLYDANLRVEECHDDVDPPDDFSSRILWSAPESGTYYLKVRHDNPYVSGCLSYSLAVRSAIPCADDYEYDPVDGSDDGAPDRARPIGLSERQIHNFHVACEDNLAHDPDTADWVVFRATESMTYTIQTSDLGGTNDTMLELYDEGILYDSGHAPLRTNDDYVNDLPVSRIVWQAPDDDDYYIKVSPFDSRVGGCGVTYALEVIPTADDLRLNGSPLKLAAGGRDASVLDACVVDENDVGVPGVTIHFTTTLGSLVPLSDTTGPSGCVTATLKSIEPGTATVTATVNPDRVQLNVVFNSYVHGPMLLSGWPPNVAPDTPSNPSPANAASNVDPRGLTLSWDGGDPDSEDLVTYEIFLGTDSSPTLRDTIGPFPATQTRITYDPGDLPGGSSHRWRVQARDQDEVETEGEEWSFTTRTCACQDPRESADDNYQGAAELDGISFENDSAHVDGYVCEAHLNAEDEEWDFYWFRVPRAGTIEVQLDVPDTVDYDLFLWDWDASAFKRSEDPGVGVDESIVHAVTRSGDHDGYYWVVVKSNGDHDSCNPYTINIGYQ